MAFGELALFLGAGLLLLAMAFGAILALIAVELRKKSNRKAPPSRPTSTVSVIDDKEKKRRQDLVARLMELYSGVHSSDALSDFLNQELEHRHEAWRVRIPPDGPGEICDLPLPEQEYD